MNRKKIALMLLLIATATAGAYAQGNGMAGINEATKMVTSYFDPGTKLIYAVGAVVGLIGESRCTISSARETLIQARPPPLGLGHVSFSSWLPPSLEASSYKRWHLGKSTKV